MLALSLLNLVSTVAGVLGIVGIVAAAIAVSRSTLAQTTIALYKADNEALRSRVDTLEASVTVERHQSAEALGRIKALEVDNARLADLATGATAVATLADKVDGHHVEIVNRLDRLTSLVEAGDR